MKIFYWSPFTSYVATIKAVINSAYGLKKCFNFDTTIINAFGEWKQFSKDIRSKKIKIIYNKKKQNIKFTNGYLKSRIAFIKIFLIVSEALFSSIPLPLTILISITSK